MTRIVSSFEGFSEPLDVNLLLNKLYRHGDRLLIFFHKRHSESLTSDNAKTTSSDNYHAKLTGSKERRFFKLLLF